MEQSFVIGRHGTEIAPVFAIILVMFVVFTAMIVTIIKTWIYCRVFSKAGYSWALGLLMLVPIAQLIMPFVLGFGDWPIQKELRALKQQPKNP
jgi:hypothetical protein